VLQIFGVLHIYFISTLYLVCVLQIYSAKGGEFTVLWTNCCPLCKERKFRILHMKLEYVMSCLRASNLFCEERKLRELRTSGSANFRPYICFEIDLRFICICIVITMGMIYRKLQEPLVVWTLTRMKMAGSLWIYAHTHTHTNMYTNTREHTRTCIYIYTRTYLYTYILHMYIYIYVYIYTPVFTYVYIYVFQNELSASDFCHS